MINKFIFSVCAQVRLQGDEVMRVLYMDKEGVTYKMVGFDDQPITIQDYRPSGIEALNTLLMDGRSRDFRERFNRPSNVLLFKGSNKDVLIQIMETVETAPPYVLWMGSGVEETIPVGYSCLFRDSRRFPNNRNAFVSLHKLPYHATTPVDRRPAADLVLQAQPIEMDVFSH